MTISINKIIETSKQFETDQLKNFKQFVDISYQLKSAIKTQAIDAQKNLKDLEKCLASLNQDVIPNGKNPMELLDALPTYNEALKSERILESGFNKPQQTAQYIDKRQNEVKSLLEQKGALDE
ncbi:hypothetical protein D210916BOD24_11170 [Alteromonas sp. D210916BOD_24]|uniref:hypothetical protein n=1 Tax=Alteromonas sp. D210916BOD_24 TaxID=3157618 RepID=UPI00399C83B4